MVGQTGLSRIWSETKKKDLDIVSDMHVNINAGEYEMTV